MFRWWFHNFGSFVLSAFTYITTRRMENFDFADDPILFLWFPIFYMIRLPLSFLKIWKYIGWFMVMFLIIWESSFVFFMSKDQYYFQEYIMYFLAVQMVCLSNIMDILVFDSNICSEITHWLKKYGLPWTAAGEGTYTMILYEIKIFKLVMIFVMFGLLVIHVTLLPFPKICQPIHRVAEEYFNDWTNIIDIMTLLVIVVIGYRTGCCIWKIFYVLKHIKIQLSVLNGLLDDISNKTNEDLSDENYQRKTYEKLIQFVKAHQRTKKLFRLIVESFGWCVYPMYLFCGLSTVSVLYLSVLGYGTAGSTQTGAYISIVVLALTSLLFINDGQQLLDESEKMFRKTYECPWYTWNQNNKKILLLLMTNSLEPMTFSSYGIVSMENSLNVKIAKLCWSLTAVLKSMKTETI